MPRSSYPWCRFWDEMLDDETVSALSPRQFRDWIEILLYSNRQSPRGQFTNIELASKVAHIPNARIQKLVDLGLLEFDSTGLRIKNWKRFQEDKPKEHRRKQRAKDPDAAGYSRVNGVGFAGGKRGQNQNQNQNQNQIQNQTLSDSFNESGGDPILFFSQQMRDAPNRNRKHAVLAAAFEVFLGQKPDYGRIGRIAQRHGGSMNVLGFLPIAAEHFEGRGDAHDYFEKVLQGQENAEWDSPNQERDDSPVGTAGAASIGEILSGYSNLADTPLISLSDTPRLGRDGDLDVAISCWSSRLENRLNELSNGLRRSGGGEGRWNPNFGE